MAAKVQISRLLWFRLIERLQVAGAGARESGGFLLAKASAQRVHRFIPYEELCPECMDGGYINFDGRGYVALSQRCQQLQLRVIGDVHTHPARWTGQSLSDRMHPMMARPGHIGLIVPHYAKVNRFHLQGVGAFEHLGNREWRDCAHEILLTLW